VLNDRRVEREDDVDLAAQLLGDLIAGSTSPLLQDFAIDRE